MSPNVAPPTITFSLLSPVIEESLSSFSPQPNINTIFSPPLPLQPFAKEKEEVEEDFEEIFKHFSFTVPISPPSLHVKTLPSIPDRVDLSPKMKHSFIVETKVPVEVEEEKEVVEDGRFTNCRKWLEGCEAARKERGEEERLLVEATKEAERSIDPHPIYSRRASISQGSRPTLPPPSVKVPPLPSTTPTNNPFSNLVVNPPRKQSDSSSLTCSSSPYSSLASTPQTSPTSSSFPSQAGSKPSSIRSTSSRFSSLSKFSFKRRSSSSSKKPNISFSSPPLPPLPSGGQFSTISDLPSLAELFPPSAPTPALVLVGEGKEKELRGGGKTRKRRDSMLGNWRDEREKMVLREKLDEAYKRIEGDGNKGMMGRKSFDL